MLTRIFSTLVLAPIAVAAVWIGRPYFEFVMILVCSIGIFEWFRLFKDQHLNLILFLVGLFYIVSPFLIIVWIYNLESVGPKLVLWILFVVWATDTGAYFIGKLLKGPKLAPDISPNKTWSGAIGGCLLALLVSMFMKPYLSVEFDLIGVTGFTIIISIFGQFGDLLESWAKRMLAVKDTGNIIPGHGGVLDRIDALLLAAPTAAFLIMCFMV